jgi:hypothetical protein
MVVLIMERSNRVPMTYNEANCHLCEAMGILVALKLVQLTINPSTLYQLKPQIMPAICGCHVIVNQLLELLTR